MATKHIYPDHTIEKRAREAGAFVRVNWEIRGPKNTQIAWMTCLQIGPRLCIVQTFKDGGWIALTDTDIDGVLKDIV